jgi:hypothetical protein
MAGDRREGRENHDWHLLIIAGLGLVIIIMLVRGYMRKMARKKKGNMSRLAEPLLSDSDDSQRGTEMGVFDDSERNGLGLLQSQGQSNSQGSSSSSPGQSISGGGAAFRGATSRASQGMQLMSAMWTKKHHRESNHQEEVHNPWKIEFEDITMKDRIGQGQFGTVFSGIYQENDVAIKQMQLSSKKDAFKKEISQAQVEIKILWSLRHPNVLMLYGSTFTKDTVTGEELMYIVTELCLGSLDVYVGNNAAHQAKLMESYRSGMPPLTNHLLLGLLRGVASALAFMHSKKVIHRDLKPDNLFIARSGKTLKAKIGDFGLSRIMKAGDKSGGILGGKYTANVGSPAYMAPELLSEGEIRLILVVMRFYVQGGVTLALCS